MSSSALNFDTITAAQKAATNALKAYVCELEQRALDAARRRDYQAAKLHSDWAFAADLCVHKVSAALSELIVETFSAPPLKDHATVELPSLERPAKQPPIELATVRLLRADHTNPEPPVA